MESPVVAENDGPVDQDVFVAGPTSATSPRIENSSLESLRASLKEEITSEIENLLVEFRKELLKLLKPKTGEWNNEEEERLWEVEREVFTPLLNPSQ